MVTQRGADAAAAACRYSHHVLQGFSAVDDASDCSECGLISALTERRLYQIWLPSTGYRVHSA